MRTVLVAMYAVALGFTGTGIYLISVGTAFGGIVLGVGCAGWWASGFATGAISIMEKIRKERHR